eukprot:GHVS01024434.1.p1 GENE.GHVS01024434.1~~GHVS01024434.1.p1  ORF type:complete len:538 (-),score=85.01 GHVS01024434.1:47-1660(-)
MELREEEEEENGAVDSLPEGEQEVAGDEVEDAEGTEKSKGEDASRRASEGQKTAEIAEVNVTDKHDRNSHQQMDEGQTAEDNAEDLGQQRKGAVGAERKEENNREWRREVTVTAGEVPDVASFIEGRSYEDDEALQGSYAHPSFYDTDIGRRMFGSCRKRRRSGDDVDPLVEELPPKKLCGAFTIALCELAPSGFRDGFQRTVRRTGWAGMTGVGGLVSASETLGSVAPKGEGAAKPEIGGAAQTLCLCEDYQKQHCRIYVGSLDYSLTEEDIMAIFQAFGSVVLVDMPRDPGDCRSKGYCFVEYSSREAADMALLSMQGFQLKGRALKVGRPTGSTAAASPCLQAGALAAASLLKGKSAPIVPIPPLLSVAAPISSPGVPPDLVAALLKSSASRSATGPLIGGVVGAIVGPHCCKVYVGSVPYSFGADDIKQIFGVFGTIVGCHLVPSESNPPTHKGYGFIDFSTPHQAKLAIDTMTGFEVGGKKLKVNHATAPRNPVPTATSPAIFAPSAFSFFPSSGSAAGMTGMRSDTKGLLS